MAGTLSNTALARKMLVEFWGDNQPHSIQEFRLYLQQNNMVSVEISHISSAVYTASQHGELERVGRGIYKAGKKLDEDVDAYIWKTGGMVYVLRKTKSILSSPINVMAISPKEQELIPKLQELYQECENLLNELESGGESDEISK